MKSKCEKSNNGSHYFTKVRIRSKKLVFDGHAYGGRLQTWYRCICCGEKTRNKPTRKAQQ